MIKDSNLERAIEYRDRLRQILSFKEGFRTWEGGIRIQFGGYEAYTSKCSYGHIEDALDVEERMIRNTLNLLKVEFTDDREPL